MTSKKTRVTNWLMLVIVNIYCWVGLVPLAEKQGHYAGIVILAIGFFLLLCSIFIGLAISLNSKSSNGKKPGLASKIFSIASLLIWGYVGIVSMTDDTIPSLIYFAPLTLLNLFVVYNSFKKVY